jgi:UDPglucose 6-dehydrogenase
MVDLAREQCGGSLVGRKVTVLGAAFKPNSDDIRDSPALAVALAARQAGAEVVVHDPKALPAVRKSHPNLDYATAVDEACEGAHVVLHLTEWAEYRAIDPVALGQVVARQVIIDGRNALDPDQWLAAGWTYRAIGRPKLASGQEVVTDLRSA